jgi:hypothetical protein
MSGTLTKESKLDQITILEDKTIEVRQANRVLEDGEILSETYHRWFVRPGDDISSQPLELQKICNAVWTPEVIASFKEQTLPVAVPAETN